MTACTAACDLKGVAVNFQEPHFPQCTPLCSRVRVSPNFALSLAAASVAWCLTHHADQLAACGNLVKRNRGHMVSLPKHVTVLMASSVRT